MIKIAVASEGTDVAARFGHCPAFWIYSTENGYIVDEAFVENTGHAPGAVPDYLSGLGVGIVIAGGMGAGAIESLNQRRMIPILGASGDVKEAVERYLRGELYSTAVICDDHL